MEKNPYEKSHSKKYTPYLNVCQEINSRCAMSCNQEKHTLETCIRVYDYYKGAGMENRMNQKI